MILLKTYLPTIAKALVAFGATLTGTLATAAVTDGVSQAELLLGISAAFAAAGVVWGVPNRQG